MLARPEIRVSDINYATIHSYMLCSLRAFVCAWTVYGYALHESCESSSSMHSKGVFGDYSLATRAEQALVPSVGQLKNSTMLGEWKNYILLTWTYVEKYTAQRTGHAHTRAPPDEHSVIRLLPEISPFMLTLLLKYCFLAYMASSCWPPVFCLPSN